MSPETQPENYRDTSTPVLVSNETDKKDTTVHRSTLHIADTSIDADQNQNNDSAEKADKFDDLKIHVIAVSEASTPKQ